VDNAGTQNLSGGFVAHLNVAQLVANANLFSAFKDLVVANGGD
jgi:hypothetical protein